MLLVASAPESGDLLGQALVGLAAAVVDRASQEQPGDAGAHEDEGDGEQARWAHGVLPGPGPMPDTLSRMWGQGPEAA